MKVTQVCCGKIHSLCTTAEKKMFSWGDGRNGKLGHNNTETVFHPKEIESFGNFDV